MNPVQLELFTIHLHLFTILLHHFTFDLVIGPAFHSIFDKKKSDLALEIQSRAKELFV